MKHREVLTQNRNVWLCMLSFSTAAKVCAAAVHYTPSVLLQQHEGEQDLHKYETFASDGPQFKNTALLKQVGTLIHNMGR